MKIAVLIKQTFDTEAKIVVKEGKVDPSGVNVIINPYDEFAIEEALRIKEKVGGEVVVFSAGSDKVTESLRKALAMGADRAVRVELDGVAVDEGVVAEALAKAVGEGNFDLVLTGWLAIDDRSAQVGVRVAEILNLSQINMVTQLELADGKLTGSREIEGGMEVVEVPLPALITAQRGLNEPRYPSMKGIMQAKKKELKVVNASDLNISAQPKVEVKDVFLPKAKEAGKIYKDDMADAVSALVKALREEAKVI
ncbi:electron transfer flavoprotein subunit beta/FixA family protein [Heliobacterium chlorum]|uniref:Electron transfer flavoprotein subunit beta n=1 Tax=Heliobacterium chlorum TaxID=2698 RepID=A0ABR7T4G5_HELCL|nr:electron transfer flavoprotein subunit beta/FixA family protein [Heliobacterium chlorum]MBC9784972.1 electron transfer flavoprotein subunit beta/FixA family protein [Heliobacterium chlorum]